jgi:1-phosphatidylinositol-3-phosphate 5-kinase/anaphase-promoting complex subunit 13
VDDEWRADVLPFDEIEIPPGISVPGDDGDDAATQAENDGPEKWNELALQFLN